MANESSTIVQRLWNYCNVLRDDGVSYGDYVEQLTYLLFLKMADEQTKPPFNKSSTIPAELDWQSLISKDGDALETHYRHILETLGKGRGMLGVIFRKSQNKIQDPAKLRRLIELINDETWIGLDIDVKGEIYEGLLQKNAEDIKSGAGQYFTPRPLIKAMVEVIKPQPTTSNKQLNFLQHVKTLLKINGKAAIVVPDNVLFEGGAGETVRRKLLQECDVHTLLRLPTGVFYAQGVKANILFFDRKPASEKPWTEKLWIYDLRTNQHFTLKTNTLKYDDLADFIKCYNPDNRFERKETDRFRGFAYNELMQRDKVSLDIFWLKDDSLEDSENLPDPDIIAKDIAENLEDALEQFRSIQEDLVQPVKVTL